MASYYGRSFLLVCFLSPWICLEIISKLSNTFYLFHILVTKNTMYFCCFYRRDSLSRYGCGFQLLQQDQEWIPNGKTRARFQRSVRSIIKFAWLFFCARLQLEQMSKQCVVVCLCAAMSLWWNVGTVNQRRDHLSTAWVIRWPLCCPQDIRE